MSLINRGVYGDSQFEPLFGIAQITVAAGPSLAEGYSVSAFVDDVGQSASGGIAVKEGDQNLSGGVIPQGIGFELFDLSIFCHEDDWGAVPTEGAILALGTAIRVRMHYAENVFELGPLALWLGPYGAPTGLNNVPIARRLAYAGPGAEARSFLCEPGQKFKLEFKATRALAAGVAASTNYVLRPCFSRRTVRRGSSAVKQ